MSGLPSTGPISASNVILEYGVSFSNVFNWRGIHSNVPASGEMRYSHLRGSRASVPTAITIGTQSVATAGSGGTGTINVGSFVNDSNGRPLTVTVTNANPTNFSSVTVNSGSNISYTTLANRWVTSASPANVSIRVVNRFGRSNTFNIPFSMFGSGIGSSAIGNITLTGTGSSVNSSEYSGVFLFMEGQYASYTSNTFSNGAAYIPNYTSGVAKSVSWDYVTENNATASWQMILAGSWSGTSGITSISLGLPSGVFEQNTTASLYTITKA
jgi:hypothetical protein